MQSFLKRNPRSSITFLSSDTFQKNTLSYFHLFYANILQAPLDNSSIITSLQKESNSLTYSILFIYHFYRSKIFFVYIDPSHFTDKYENNYSSPRVKERTPKLHGVRVSFSNKEQGVVFESLWETFAFRWHDKGWGSWGTFWHDQTDCVIRDQIIGQLTQYL